MKLLDRYQESLRSIPEPGWGCHASLLTAANYGIMSGRCVDQVFGDIRGAIPQGKRRISDREITDAIRKALQDHNGGTLTPRPRPKPIVRDGKTALQKIIDQAKISDESDLWEASPIRLWEKPKNDPALLLSTLYEPTDLIWIGNRFDAGVIGKTIRTASEWITFFRNSGKTTSQIILNPLTGTPTMKKTGNGETFRSDANVGEYRFCLVEFDDLPRESQIRFWSAAQLPVVALIDSGGKSIHAWIDVQKLVTVKTAEQWDIEIKGRLYDQIITPLGVDAACSNPARLSRLPGHYREEKSAYQRLLWLSAEGRAIC